MMRTVRERRYLGQGAALFGLFISACGYDYQVVLLFLTIVEERFLIDEHALSFCAVVMGCYLLPIKLSPLQVLKEVPHKEDHHRYKNREKEYANQCLYFRVVRLLRTF